MNEVIKVVDLEMKINKRVLLENLNFTIYGGEIVGLLGHNGVGKSTIQRILANRENPTGGKIYNRGHIQRMEVDVNNIVYVPDTITLIPNLTIAENFELITKCRPADREFFDKYIKGIRLEQNQQVRSLSKGNQELVQIITLLSINASLYLLDEPFSAVDIFRRELIQKIIIDVSLRNEESSIVITSHLISEVEPMLSRVLYLDDGQIVIDCDLEQILEESPSLIDYLKVYFGDKVGYDHV